MAIIQYNGGTYRDDRPAMCPACSWRGPLFDAVWPAVDDIIMCPVCGAGVENEPNGKDRAPSEV